MQQLPRILAQAIVDPGRFEIADRVNNLAFIVTVDGRLYGGDRLPRRKYDIEAPDEDHAAHAGLERYVAEMDKAH